MSENEQPHKLVLETVEVARLKRHPRNYRGHPPEQIQHICASIQQHGVYRPVVICRDDTILAGHGIVEALLKLGIQQVQVIRMPYYPLDARALKLLAADNEIEHLAIDDDRLLTDLLKEIREADIDGLLGTGYDEAMLAALAMVTRPREEIASFDEAQAWVGLPEYEHTNRAPRDLQILVHFRNWEDRAAFGEILGLALTDRTRDTYWPPKEEEDVSSLRFLPGEALADELVAAEEAT